MFVDNQRYTTRLTKLLWLGCPYILHTNALPRCINLYLCHFLFAQTSVFLLHRLYCHITALRQYYKKEGRDMLDKEVMVVECGVETMVGKGVCDNEFCRRNNCYT